MDVKAGEEPTACLECLALRRKVVFVSVKKQYVWIVKFQQSLPNCEFCSMMTPVEGRAIPYNQYLPQISSNEMYEHVYGNKEGPKLRQGHDKVYRNRKRKQQDEHHQVDIRNVRMAKYQ